MSPAEKKFSVLDEKKGNYVEEEKKRSGFSTKKMWSKTHQAMGTVHNVWKVQQGEGNAEIDYSKFGGFYAEDIKPEEEQNREALMKSMFQSEDVTSHRLTYVTLSVVTAALRS